MALRHLDRDDARTAMSTDSAKSLADALRKSIEGEIRFDKGTSALYATDGSNYRQEPIGVVIPRNAQDVKTTVRLVRERGAPIYTQRKRSIRGLFRSKSHWF